MLFKVLVALLLASIVPNHLFAQDSKGDEPQLPVIDFKGPEISDYLWTPVTQGDNSAAKLQASITDDDQLEFARLSLTLKNGLRCGSQNSLIGAGAQSILNLSRLTGRENTYETTLRESRLKDETGVEGFTNACYWLEAQDRSGNLSLQWIEAPFSGAATSLVSASLVQKSGEKKSLKRWGTALAAVVVVALLVSSAGSSSGDSNSSADTLTITAPVPQL